MDTADPYAAANAQRLAPWSIILLVASAMTLTVAVILGWLPLAILAGLVGLGGLALLVLTSLRGGRRDAPRL